MTPKVKGNNSAIVLVPNLRSLPKPSSLVPSPFGIRPPKVDSFIKLLPFNVFSAPSEVVGTKFLSNKCLSNQSLTNSWFPSSIPVIPSAILKPVVAKNTGQPIKTSAAICPIP